MAEDRNQNQIIRKDARNCFVESLNDAFEIGRIHLAFATYDLSKPAGQRQTNNIHIYIAVDETRIKMRSDTQLINFPLFCPKCRKETLIHVEKFKVSVITEPDAQTQSR